MFRMIVLSLLYWGLVLGAWGSLLFAILMGDCGGPDVVSCNHVKVISFALDLLALFPIAWLYLFIMDRLHRALERSSANPGDASTMSNQDPGGTT